jgi:lysophospholipase
MSDVVAPNRAFKTLFAMPVPFVSIPENPCPANAEAFDLKTSDGVLLRVGRFKAPSDRPFKGTVCLFQGRGEFIEKYFEVIGELNERGFTVAALDWRGQGGSQRRLKDPRRGHVRHFDDFQLDILAFMEDFARPECHPPFFGLAHSMGGPILLEATRRRATWWDRLVLTAPMIGLPGLAADPLTRRLAVLLVWLGMGTFYVPGGSTRDYVERGFENNVLTSDPKRHARLVALVNAAPHLTIGSPTIAWLRSAHRAMELLEDPERVSQIRTPTLFFEGSEDKIIANRPMELLAHQMRTAEVITLPTARHELLMERDAVRAAFWTAFDAFIPGSSTF